MAIITTIIAIINIITSHYTTLNNIAIMGMGMGFIVHLKLVKIGDDGCSK